MLKKALLGLAVLVVSFAVALGVMNWLWPVPPASRPALVAPPPLPPASGRSVVVAPVTVLNAALLPKLEALAPRDLAGKGANPLGDVLSKADINWQISRGALAIAGKPDGLTVSSPLNGTLRVAGTVGNQAQNLGNIVGNLVGNRNIGDQIGRVAGKNFDESANIRGNFTLTSRPALTPAWRIAPNLAAQVTIADVGLAVLPGVRVSVAKEMKPIVDRAVNEQMNLLQARIAADPALENNAREQWAKMCRSVPIKNIGQGVPDLWLELKPVRAVAAQPRTGAQGTTFAIGVEAQSRVQTAATQPTCPFPQQLDIVPFDERGRINVALPIDIPLAEANKMLQAALKGKTFPEDGAGSFAATIETVQLDAHGEQLLITLGITAKEKKSWFGLGASGTVFILGKPVLDVANQALRFSDLTLDVQSQAAFGLLGTAAQAVLPYIQPAIAEKATLDLKPIIENAKKSVATVLADYRTPQPGVKVDTSIDTMRLDSIAFDAKTLRIVLESEGTLKIEIAQLP